MKNDLKVLKQDIKDAKFNMWYTKPLSGYLGNQYLYWHSKYEELRNQLEKLKTV